MTILAMIIRSCFGIALLLSVVAQTTRAASLRGIAPSPTPHTTMEGNDSFVVCRMVMVHTLVESTSDDEAEFHDDEPASCIPIENGIDTDDIVPMPPSFTQDTVTTHFDALHQKNLVIVITNATLRRELHEIAATHQSEYLIYVDQQAPSHPEHLRRYLPQAPLQKRGRRVGNLAAGTMTVAVLRISTTDSTPTATTSDLDGLFDTNAINFVTQYKQCSMGQLNFVKAASGVMEVQVNQPVSAFPSGSALVSAAQAVVRTQLNLKSVDEIADRVIMCLPPGTGDWVANAGINHWYAQFNDGWCTSLTANMHELGHTLGLMHSNENSIKYGDSTGYMSKAYTSPTAPQRCFNGQNHLWLGWYNRRKLTITHPTQLPDGAKLKSLAAFVDFDKAAQGTPVLINLSNLFYLQYNRAKSFNAGTGEHPDTVTITTPILNGVTNLVASLSVGQQYQVENFNNSGQALIIQACSAMAASSPTEPDIMTVSIGMGKSLCGS